MVLNSFRLCHCPMGGGAEKNRSARWKLMETVTVLNKTHGGTSLPYGLLGTALRLMTDLPPTAWNTELLRGNFHTNTPGIIPQNEMLH